MKKKYFLLLLALAAANLVFSQSQQISSWEAENAATNWIRFHYPEYQSKKNVVSLMNRNGNILLYEVRFDSINILLSGSKACLPILGYYKGSVSFINDMANLPCNLRSFINSFIEEIDSCFANDTIKLYHRGDWNTMIEGTSSGVRSTVVVPPLITTQWNQSTSNTGGDAYAYNFLIPPDDDYNCDHQLVGCGAVALAQVMNYWQYPLLYEEQKQFDWCNMTESLNKYTDNKYERHRDAIAYLMYRCAEDINSEYGCTETSSSLNDTRSALVSTYGYDNSAQYLTKASFSNMWAMLIRTNLDAGYPIIYRGSGSGGHAFVCDGYKDDGSYHFNWGWGGSWDSYFYLDQLTPGSNNYSNNQAAIFFIHPSSNTSICNANIFLDDFYDDNISLLNDYEPYEITPKTMTILTSASIASTASWRTIPSESSAVYQAHEEVNLENGFESERGSEFEVRIEPCEKCEEMRGNSETEGCVDGGEDVSSEGDTFSLSVPHTNTPDLFPNPTRGPLTMVTDGMAESVIVFDLQGHPVGGWHLETLMETAVVLDVSPLRPGPYLLTVTTSVGSRTVRFLRL